MRAFLMQRPSSGVCQLPGPASHPLHACTGGFKKGCLLIGEISVTLCCAVQSHLRSREGSLRGQVGTSGEDGAAGSHRGLETPPEGSGCCGGLPGLECPNGWHSRSRFLQLHCPRASVAAVDEPGLGVDSVIVQKVPCHSRQCYPPSPH